ncbi:MAG TPA: hypothetical protein PLU24_04065, partial [Candidatus Omnitrophota bacterium]|nr:hypothetical protein [Candidatus Omnitrophota bacterium]
FFQDLVETNIFYVALFPEKKEVVFNKEWFDRENLFNKLLPESSRFEKVIGVFEPDKRLLKIMSDVLSQRVVCFQPKKGEQ